VGEEATDAKKKRVGKTRDRFKGRSGLLENFSNAGPEPLPDVRGL
jgi:hypothetical protein